MRPRFCPQCGTPVTMAAANFCAACGVDLRTGGAPEAASAGRSRGRAAGIVVPAAPAPTWQLRPAGLGLAGFVFVAGLAMWAVILEPAPPKAGLGASQGGAPPAAGANEAAATPAELPSDVKTFITDLAKQAEGAPEDLALWDRLGQVYYRAGQFDPSYYAKALAAYEHVLSRDANNLEAVRGKANVYYDQNDHVHAIPLYEKVLAATPDDPNAKTDLATMYLYAGDPTRAVKTYQEVIAKHPDFVQAHYNLAITWAQGGDTEKAMVELRQARELAKDDGVRKQIDDTIAHLSGSGTQMANAGRGDGAAAPAPPRAAATGGGASGAAPAAPSTARTPFQTDVEQRLRAAPIMGDRITRFEWSGASSGRVVVDNFPMTSMPPVVRDKFTGRLTDELRAAAKTNPPGGEVKLEIADASGSVMATVTP